MQVRFCGSQDDANPSGGLCEEYRLSDIEDLPGLIAVSRRIAADCPGCRPFLSLDDFGQARYTSGHAVMDHDLDATLHADLSGLPAECFENGAHRGYLSHPAEFSIRAANFARAAAGVDFAEACGFGLTLDNAARAEWSAFQEDPVGLLDQPVSLLLVPAARGEEALAAFPNGYFTCDLSPALNAAVARHFRQRHDYELIGIGASYLGLWREAPPTGTAVDAIARDFAALYNVAEEDWMSFGLRVRAAITGRRHLWLRYTE